MRSRVSRWIKALSLGLVSVGLLGEPVAAGPSSRPSCLPDCRNAILVGANLRGLDLRTANFDNATLEGANLQGVNLKGASLQGTNLSHANLKGANLKNTQLHGAQLYRANLSGANLSGASLSTSNLHHVSWNRTICPNGQRTRSGCDQLQAAPQKTIGLWHETTPSGTWGFVTRYQDFVDGPNGNKLGFQSYATDYVNFVRNLQAAAQSQGFGLGPIYLQGGDPGPDDWTPTQTSNNAFKYLSPNPASGQRPMINQYVVEPLAKLGVRQFGLVVTLNPWNGSQWTAPWGWVPSGSDPDLPTGPLPAGLPKEVNPSAIALFKLLFELNSELKSSYTSQGIPPSQQLYITLLGFDNEGFNMVPAPSCPKETPPAGSSSGLAANTLWNFYVKSQGFSLASTPQWGITGQSPPFEDFCDPQGKIPLAGTSRQFAFIEYYNVPGESNPVFTFDHPGFVPCSTPWNGSVTDQQCLSSTEPYYQIAYGTVTPSFSSEPVPGLKRPVSLSTLYSGLNGNGWSAIWSGITQAEVWKRTPVNGALSQTFIQAAYAMLDQIPTGLTRGNLTTMSQSSLYCTGDCSAGAGTPDPGTEWMLSIENFSSSYRTLINPSPNQAERVATSAVDTLNPFSSIALKYGPNQPFDLDRDKGQYILSHPTTASGTYEAFGGWGVDNLAALMAYMSQQNPLLTSFMIYEYAFVQLNDTKPPGSAK